jgi:hypothetical protein
VCVCTALYVRVGGKRRTPHDICTPSASRGVRTVIESPNSHVSDPGLGTVRYSRGTLGAGVNLNGHASEPELPSPSSDDGSNAESPCVCKRAGGREHTRSADLRGTVRHCRCCRVLRERAGGSACGVRTQVHVQVCVQRRAYPGVGIGAGVCCDTTPTSALPLMPPVRPCTLRALKRAFHAAGGCNLTCEHCSACVRALQICARLCCR